MPRDVLEHLLQLADAVRLAEHPGVDRKRQHPPGAGITRFFIEEVERIRKTIEKLCQELGHLVGMDIFSKETGTAYFDIDQAFLKAIRISTIRGKSERETIHLTSQGRIFVNSNERDFVMMFTILLLLSISCLNNIRHKRLHCSTGRDGNTIVVNISHEGSAHRDADLNILLQRHLELERFLEYDTSSFMKTILTYGSVLLSKYDVALEVDNTPGRVNMTLFIPASGNAELQPSPDVS